MAQYLRPCCLLSIALACLVAGAAAQQTKSVKMVPPRTTAAISGQAIYTQYCAVCHGVDGKGDGPVADALKQRPSDLTGMSRRSNGKFPEDHFLKIINGETRLVAHGAQNMPIWGDAFRNMSTSQTVSQDRIYGLMNYIEQIQAK